MRKLILELYNRNSSPVPLLDVAKIAGISLSDLKTRLNQEKKLDSIGDIRIHEASKLIKYYGKGLLFDQIVEEKIEEFMKVSKRIREIEEKCKKKYSIEKSRQRDKKNSP